MDLGFITSSNTCIIMLAGMNIEQYMRRKHAMAYGVPKSRNMLCVANV